MSATFRPRSFFEVVFRNLSLKSIFALLPLIYRECGKLLLIGTNSNSSQIKIFCRNCKSSSAILKTKPQAYEIKYVRTVCRFPYIKSRTQYCVRLSAIFCTFVRNVPYDRPQYCGRLSYRAQPKTTTALYISCFGEYPFQNNEHPLYLNNVYMCCEIFNYSCRIALSDIKCKIKFQTFLFLTHIQYLSISLKFN